MFEPTHRTVNSLLRSNPCNVNRVYCDLGKTTERLQLAHSHVCVDEYTITKKRKRSGLMLSFQNQLLCLDHCKRGVVLEFKERIVLARVQ